MGLARGILISGVRRTVSQQQITELGRRAADADLFESHSYPQDDVVDTSTLTIRIISTEDSYETTVVQPSADDDGDRGRVVAFADAAARTGTDAGEYRSTRAAALSQLPGAPSRPCLVVEGDDLASLSDQARSATDRTRWSSEGQRVRLLVRPLLPDERDCADVVT